MTRGRITVQIPLNRIIEREISEGVAKTQLESIQPVIRYFCWKPLLIVPRECEMEKAHAMITHGAAHTESEFDTMD